MVSKYVFSDFCLFGDKLTVCFQYSQVRRQWLNYRSYIVVTKRLAQKLMQTTTRMTADDELMCSCAIYALYAMESSWPVLPERMRISISRLKDRMSHFDPSAAADDHLFGDLTIVLDLQNFIANTLVPEYVQVWVKLKNAEASILEKMSGDVFNALEDLQLQFQLTRFRFIDSGVIMRAWQSTLFGSSLNEKPTKEEFLRQWNIPYDISEEDMPPFLVAMLASPGPVAQEVSAAAMMQFEGHVYDWFVKNMFILFGLEGSDDLASSEPDCSEPPVDPLDVMTGELVEEAGWSHLSISFEYVGTVLYIAGAAVSRAWKWCRAMSSAVTNTAYEQQV